MSVVIVQLMSHRLWIFCVGWFSFVFLGFFVWWPSGIISTESAQQGAEHNKTFQGFPTRMVYLHCISCLRYTILVGNPRNFVVDYIS